MIHPQRIQPLNDQPQRKGQYVLYWMQASQRCRCNHALEYAIRQANERNEPVVAVFGLTDEYPEANLRHYTFMLEGLRELQPALRRRGVQLVVRHEHPPQAALELAGRASMIVTDAGYTRVQVEWRSQLAEQATCPVVQVESDVIVPVETASPKEEYSAGTFRPKLSRLLPGFLVPLRESKPKRDSLSLRPGGVDISDIEAVLGSMNIDRTVPACERFHGGSSQADRLLRQFIRHKLADYPAGHNDPSVDGVSHMSPYLHFGQISPLAIALAVRAAPGVGDEALQAYMEQLIVRRELAINFVYYNPDYDTWAALPNWARKTLDAHAADPRPALYTLDQLEHARTADEYWNAAQREMVVTGKMHNTMRMYWGKRLLEWTARPEEAFRIALYLNNRYHIDGRDPNAFAGVAWCFGKHDRPWAHRPIFGAVRYMNAAGLRRKYDMDAYLQKTGTGNQEQGTSRS